MDVVHNAMHSRNFAKFAQKAGVNYTVYYTDYNGMTADDAGDKKFSKWNYNSSHDWVEQPGVGSVGRASAQEQQLYFCMMFGLECSASPSPSPSPTELPESCKKAIDNGCMGMDCTTCIHTH